MSYLNFISFGNALRFLKSNTFFWLLLSLTVLPAQSKAESVLDAPDRKAVLTELGAQSVLLAGAKSSQKVVLVGERGIIISSDDEGQHWQQADVPVSVTLTNIRFANEKIAYALGHGGIVLKTLDGGQTWQRVLDGLTIIQILLDQAEKSQDEELLRIAKQFEADGPDKPLFGILISDEKSVKVTGAYGLALETDDGGKTWTSWAQKLDNPFGYHLYNIKQRDDRVLIAGEAGVVFLSVDKGQSYSPLLLPYEGSFFTADLLGEVEIILAGLQGNVWKSVDNGESWTQVKTFIPSTITGSVISTSDELMLVNQAGFIMAEKHGQYLPLNKIPMPSLTGIIENRNGDFLALSVKGVISHKARPQQDEVQK